MMFTSIKVILNDLNEKIPAEYWDENEMLERCAKAMEKIGTYVSLEKKVELIAVKDHIGYLPKALVNIEQIAYKRSNILTDQDIGELRELILHPNPSSTYYDGFFVSPYYYNNFKPLRRATSGFAHGHNCEDCNQVTNGEHEYVVNPNGTIMTSFRDGYVCVAYTRYPIDDDGDFLIPDLENVKQAITYYCMSHFWEKRYNMMEEGAENRWRTYLGLYETANSKAKAELMMPTVDGLENIRQMQRLLPVDRRYYSFFGNLSTSEHLSMNGVFHNNNRY